MFTLQLGVPRFECTGLRSYEFFGPRALPPSITAASLGNSLDWKLTFPPQSFLYVDKMCGILALLSQNVIDEKDLRQLLDLIDRRGPDFSSPLVQVLTDQCRQLKFKASVLHLMGQVLQRQPHKDNDGNHLLFNGQIHNYSGKTFDSNESDTAFLASRLQQSLSPDLIPEVFTEIEGPYAFIYWHHQSNRLFYGRDIFGRKSMCLLKANDACPIIISSVADVDLETHGLRWHEVDCTGIHCIDFKDNKPKQRTFRYNLDTIYPRTRKCNVIDDVLDCAHLKISHLKTLNADMTPPDEFDDVTRHSALSNFEAVFLQAVTSRLGNNQKTCLNCRKSSTSVCFDSKAAVAFSGGVDSTLITVALDKIMHESESIDLITVAFKDESPDRVSVKSAFLELLTLCPNRKWRLVICDISKDELQLERDAQIRKLILPCDSVFDDGIGCACWFVGRARGRAITSPLEDEWISENLDTFLRYNPTSVDLSDTRMASDYTSPASMMFVGSSIDEQLGGYSSHRKAWQQEGANGLYEEVSFLMRRLSSRNLGRDDRVYCHFGRDVKLPFLDFRLVSFLNELPLGLKMNLGDSLDRGPKKILRDLALKWGLAETGKRVKRAMQFGTRIANLESFKEKGGDVCSRLRHDFMSNNNNTA